MNKTLKRIAVAVVVVAVGIQAVRPARTNPPVVPSQTIYAQMHVPADVRAILERSCRDCHSNETRWPWYSNVAPVSWLVVDDVNHGRSHLNFSEWAGYDEERSRELLGDIAKEVKMGEMPLRSYLMMHGDAKLGEDAGKLISWGESRGWVARQAAEPGKNHDHAKPHKH